MTNRGFLFSTDAIAAAVILILAISAVSFSIAPTSATRPSVQDDLVDQTLMILYHHEMAVTLDSVTSPTHFCRSAFYVNPAGHVLSPIDNSSTDTPGAICQ